jgi:PAS domain S-box-containing protein
MFDAGQPRRKKYTETVLLRDLPPRGRWYILSVIALGTITFCALLPRAEILPLLPLLFLILLSSLTSAFKVQLPIASGSNMSVSYVVDIASLILRGPHTTMLVGAASGWSQTNLNSKVRNPVYRTLFNMAMLVITVQVAGQVYTRLGGSSHPDLNAAIIAPLAGMAVTYFFVNTIPIAVAIALTTNQSAWRIWKTDFASSAPSYLLGAAAAAVVISVTESSGYWLTLLLTAAPLYLTYRMYRAGVESEAQQGAILEAAHDAIITMDSRLNIREFNPAAEQMFGYARLDILGRNVDLLLREADRAEHARALSEYLAFGTGPMANRQLELTALKADGTEFPVELSVARVGQDARAVVTGFIRDITERRLLEEQLRQSQKLEAIGRLAGGVAHDFNNILMSIMGAADLLLMQLGRDDPATDEASEIKQAVVRGAGLTRQLLAFSRRQATRSRLFALGEVVRGMDTMLRRLIGPEIEFEIVTGDEPVSVVADSGHIEQVVLNLVVNARDAMPEGGRITVRVDETEIDEAAALAFVEGKAGRYARLSVADTGTGIDEQTRARLFEPFFTTKEQGKGTGLGLSIVYGIVKQSGGYITVASEPGRGATFIIYLPLAAAPLPAPVPA